MSINLLGIPEWGTWKAVMTFAIVVLFLLFLKLDRENKNNGLKLVGLLLIGLTIYLIGDAMFQTSKGWGWPGHIDLGKDQANTPNYFVFLATAISAYYIYRTLNSQRKANQIAAFENRFFKFIDYHRENVTLMKYHDPNRKGNEYREGNQVFTSIYYEMRDMVIVLLQNRKNPGKPAPINEKRQVIDFAYQAIFYGATVDGLPVMQRNFAPEVREHYYQCTQFAMRSAEYSDVDEAFKYYAGHIRRLGQYFRNIYQAVQYVDKQDFLTANQKYSYVSILRAQMSMYEQLVFFFTSISRLGENWEYREYDRNLPAPKSKWAKRFDRLLITKYDLVRNLFRSDGTLLEELGVKEFYPLITMEKQEECSLHGKLKFANRSTHICRFCFNEKYIGYCNEDPYEKIELCYNTDKGQFKGFHCDEDCPTKDELEFLENKIEKQELRWRTARRRLKRLFLDKILGIEKVRVR
jgi:hypothetical protein